VSLATFYERMFFIRRFEETLLDLFSLGKLVGTTHTYIGQEANAVGLIDHLDPDVDTIFEIGAQDAKYIFLHIGAPTDYAMNAACSAGSLAPSTA